jgi:hypothetical protein
VVRAESRRPSPASQDIRLLRNVLNVFERVRITLSPTDVARRCVLQYAVVRRSVAGQRPLADLAIEEVGFVWYRLLRSRIVGVHRSLSFQLGLEILEMPLLGETDRERHGHHRILVVEVAARVCVLAGVLPEVVEAVLIETSE